MRWLRNLVVAGAGAAAAYLLDPVSGRSRRARLSDQARARLSQTTNELQAKGRYEMGRVKGAIHEAGPDTDFPVDDAELLQKVRSEAVGPSRIRPSDIEIHVDAGEVVVRGVSRDQEAEHDLVDRIRGVTGVTRVRNELTTV